MSHPHAGVDNPSANGKFKSPHVHRLRWQRFSSRFAPLLFTVLFLIFFFYASRPFISWPSSSYDRRRDLHSAAWGGPDWERRVRHSSRIRNTIISADNHNNHRNGQGLCVLVTGAAGFVGSHVSMALRKRGDGVLGIDNFNNYYDQSLKRARQGNMERAGIFIVEGDINDAELLRKLFDMVAFTHVMHLAAQAGVRYAMKNPDSYVRSNVAGLVNVLEVCKSANPQPAVVWASSSSVYGLNSKVPFSEGDRTDHPASLYAATKKAGEAITHTYNNIHGLSITGLRFFTVYGPWGRPDMAYFSFTKDILRGKQITIYEGPNHGAVARDFTYIDDIVRGCLGALDTAGKSTGGGGVKKGSAQYRIFNLGNTSPVSVLELVDELEKLLKVKANKKILDMPRNGDVLFTHANISLAKRELGYQPTTDLHTGLKKFVKWYINHYVYSHKASW